MKNKPLMVSLILLLALIIVGAIGWTLFRKDQAIKSIESDYNTSNLDGAIKTAEEIIASDPNNIPALLAVATTYAQRGSVTFNEGENAAKAIEYADRVIALDANNSEAYRIKGYSYEIQEQYELAHENYDTAIKLDPNNAQAYSNKGHAYDLQGDLAQAEVLYIKALEVSSTNEHALLNAGRLYVRQNRYDDAKIALDSVMSASQSNRFKAEAYQLLAYVHFMEADIPTAREAIDNALKLDPEVAQAWVMKARIELSTVFDMESQEALDALVAKNKEYANTALRINPNQTSAYMMLSDIAIITGNKAEQDEYRAKALEAVDLDISLGAQEKKDTKATLQATIKIQN